MATPTEVATRIINNLNIVDPELNTGVATPVREIIDAVAIEIAGVTDSNARLMSQFNIDTYSGTQLDELCSLFGFTRKIATQSYGTVTFQRINADTELYIPQGTQFVRPETQTSNAVMFTTTNDTYMVAGQTTIYIPCISVLGGAFNNVPANTITGQVNSTYTTRIWNAEAFTGGRDYENDDALRTRFKATVFKNIAGTRDQYIAIAESFDSVNSYRMFSIRTNNIEYVTVNNGAHTELTDIANIVVDSFGNPKLVWVNSVSTGTSLVPNSDYNVTVSTVGNHKQINITFNEIPIVKEPVSLFYNEPVNLEHSRIKTGTVTVYDSDDNVLNNAYFDIDLVNGIITRIDDTNIFDGIYTVSYTYSSAIDGDIVSIEYDYTSKQLHPVYTTALYIDGEIQTLATDSRYIAFNNLEEINNDNSSSWVRMDGTSDNPTNGNRIMPLVKVPVISLPTTIGLGDGQVILNLNADYWLLKDVTQNGNSIYACDAIEFDMGNAVFADGLFYKVNIDYFYDILVEQLQNEIENRSPVSTTAIVKKSNRRYFGVYMDVMVTSYSQVQASDAINTRLAEFFATYTMGNTIQFADIEREVANIQGIDACKIYIDNTDNCGIVEYYPGGTTRKTTYKTPEYITLSVIDMPIFVSAVINTKTQGVWT